MNRILLASLLSLCLFTPGLKAGEEGVRWEAQPLLAGKVSLLDSSYHIIRPVGVTQTSPDLRLPIQLHYISTSDELGLLGHGWRIPQLESRAVHVDKNMDWTTPWGETIRFFPKTKPTEDMLAIFQEEMKGPGAFFAPYSEWIADGADGAWTIKGKGAKKNWVFKYENAKLQQISAPSGFTLDFRYDKQGRLEKVVQEKRAFLEIDYEKKSEQPSGMTLNGIKIVFTYAKSSVDKLPDTPAAKPAKINRVFLASYRIGDIAPVTFEYSTGGFLTAQKQAEFLDSLTIEKESPAERAAYLAAAAQAKAEKKNINTVKREKIDGRLLADVNFDYAYPTKDKRILKDKVGQTAEYAYDTGRGVLALSDFSGKKSTLYYFMRHDVAYNGRIRQVVDARDRVVVNYRYDKATGNVTRVRDMADNEILMSYNKDGDLARVEKRGADDVNAAPVAKFDYDRDGRLMAVSKLGEAGKPYQTTAFRYTSKNQPSRVDNGQTTVRIKYNDFGYPTEITNVFDQTVTLKYSRHNQLESSQNHDGQTTVYMHNTSGLVTKVERFADAGRKELISSLEVAYNDTGLPVSYLDQRSRKKSFERDAFGRVMKEFFPDETQVAYQYNALGQLNQVLDQNGHEIAFDWGRFGLNSRQTPEEQATVYDYNNFGLLKSVKSMMAETKKVDRAIEYQHDDLDRVVRITYDKTRSEAFTYDSWGRVVKSVQTDFPMAREATFKYDHFGRLVEKTETVLEGPQVTETTKRAYEYNRFGQRTARKIQQTNLKGEVFYATEASWSYDDFGRLVAMTEGADKVNYTFNNRNQLIKRVANGMPTLYTYTTRGQLDTKALGGLPGEPGAQAWVTYTYDPDGRIAGREVSGEKMRYEYDAKDQLLAVINAEGQDVERYTYDPAGNIMKKAIHGKTTTFTYDKANQLLTQTDPDGKVTDFAYDAAGRMVKEGTKTYAYGFLDKVLQIAENGRTVNTFAYWPEGQLAQRRDASSGRIDSFLWDDLALIKRNATQYLNEPHASGGTPVLAGGNPLLEDLLGNTLGVSTDGRFHAILRTSFGQRTEDEITDDAGTNAVASALADSDFHTGKPEVEGLGYAFLFRNYRQDLGKWTSTDPMGYPDGWNNLAYCNNWVTECLDAKGTDIYHLIDRQGAKGNGHSAWIVGNDTDGYTAYSYGEKKGKGENVKGSFTSLSDAVNFLNDKRGTATAQYDAMQKVQTFSKEDSYANMHADYYYRMPYNLLTHNCYQLGEAMINTINTHRPEDKQIQISSTLRPKNAFDQNQSHFGWRPE